MQGILYTIFAKIYILLLMIYFKKEAQRQRYLIFHEKPASGERTQMRLKKIQ